MPDYKSAGKDTNKEAGNTKSNAGSVKTQSNAARIIQRAAINPCQLTEDDLLMLQRTIGNRELHQLLSSLQAKKDNTAHKTAEAPERLKRDNKMETPDLSSLKVSDTQDAQEIEADRMADKVMTMPTVPILAFQGNGNNLSDQGLLPGDILYEMSNKIGEDFSHIKIHNDSNSSYMNKQLGSRAFTYGSNIYFDAGQYNPQSFEGKKLLAHELTHIAQNNNNDSSIIQRKTYPDTRNKDIGAQVATDSRTLEGLLQDCRQLISYINRQYYKAIMIFSQNGLDVYDVKGDKHWAHYKKRESESLPPSGFWNLDETGGATKFIYIEENPPYRYFRPENVTIKDKESSGFSEERLKVISKRGNNVSFFDDYTKTTASELAPRGYLPALVVVQVISGGKGGSGKGQPQLEDWAAEQVNKIGKKLGVEVGASTGTTGKGSNKSALSSNSEVGKRRPVRLVPWARKEDGAQFVNVWVGGRDSTNGGVVESIELKENETPDELQARIESAAIRARGKLTEKAVDEEQKLTKGSYLYNQWTYTGGGGSEGLEANRPSFRADISGPEFMVPKGTGAYRMSLHYEDVYQDLLGQVAAAFNGADYVWQIIDITPLYQQLMRERAADVQRKKQQLANGEPITDSGPGRSGQEYKKVTQQGTDSMATVGRFDAEVRDFERRYGNFTEDAAQAAYDLANPIDSQDGSASRAVRSVLVNSFNLASLPLHAILSLGGWLVSAFSSVFANDPQYEREIPFPNENGYYLIRCIAQPRDIESGEKAIRRMPSLAVKVIEVKDIKARTEQELVSHKLNVESAILELLINFRVSSDEERPNIRRLLEFKIQEAAQNNKAFLDEQIGIRRKKLTEKDISEDLRRKIEEELDILSRGAKKGAGLISDILQQQIVLKEKELEEARKAGNPYKIRDIEKQLSQLQRRQTTAKLREAEIQGDGQPIVRPNAVFVNEENGQTYPLLIEIGQVGSQKVLTGFTMRLSDVTGTDSDQFDATNKNKKTAVEKAIEEYAGHFPYGRGYITVSFPENQNFGITTPIMRHCNPRDTAQASERLDELLQILAVIGLFIPGIGLAAAGVGAAVSIGRMLSRISNHTFAWDSNAVMDIFNIIGAVASGVSRVAGAQLIKASNLFAVVPESENYAQWVSRLSRFKKAVDFVDKSANNISYMIGSMETVKTYFEIQKQEIAGEITHAEARRQRARLMSQSLYDNFMQHAAGMIEGYSGDGKKIVPAEGISDESVHQTDEGTTLADQQRHMPDQGAQSPDGERHKEGVSVETPQALSHGAETEAAEKPSGQKTKPEDGQARVVETPVKQPEVNQPEVRQPEVNQPEIKQPEVKQPEGKQPDGKHPESNKPADPEGSVRAFLGDRANTRALLQGERSTFIKLIESYGSWRDLIMFLQREPNNDMYKYLIDELTAIRSEIVKELGTQFGLSLSDPKASTKASSDVDLASTGVDAGKKLTQAEAYMKEKYGSNWKEILRMNFYTQAERVFMYEQVKGMMKGSDFAAFQGRISDLAEVLNFAKMLQHAGNNAESNARIDALMSRLSPEQQKAARDMAAETPEQAQKAVAVLHANIDVLCSRLENLKKNRGKGIPEGATGDLPATLPAHMREAISRALTPDELQVAYAQAITELQMHANFRTEEAYISPGASRHVVRGVAVKGHEAYQSALSNLEMMEHAIHSAGGSVERAIREYELYKYICRFTTAMQLAGIPMNPFMLTYYQAAYDVYNNNRTALQGVRQHDLSYLSKMYAEFIKEAADILPRMKENARANPEQWNPNHRSLEVTGTMLRDTSPEETSKPDAEPGITDDLTIGGLLGDRSGISSIAHVPVKKAKIDGNETRARFVRGKLVLELGPAAGHVQVMQHLDTLRALQRYEGVIGLIRRLSSRIGELLGMGPGYGRRGHEAQLEIKKLLGIRQDLEFQRNAVETAMRDKYDQSTLKVLTENYAEIISQIDKIEAQIRQHERDVDSFKPAKGYVAMANTTPPIDEKDPRFRQQPQIGETWRYKDHGGSEGTVTRLAYNTMAIETELGQTTVRADYQSWLTPEDVGLASGRQGFEALHAVGPGVGHESPFGIYMGPWRVNQLIQSKGIEKFIARIGKNLLPGKKVFLRVEVERVTLPVKQADGSVMQVDFLKRITYQLYGVDGGKRTRLFSLEVSVDRPNDPKSSVDFDRDSIFINSEIGKFANMEKVVEGAIPNFKAKDPMDE